MASTFSSSSTSSAAGQQQCLAVQPVGVWEYQQHLASMLSPSSTGLAQQGRWGMHAWGCSVQRRLLCNEPASHACSLQNNPCLNIAHRSCIAVVPTRDGVIHYIHLAGRRHPGGQRAPAVHRILSTLQGAGVVEVILEPASSRDRRANTCSDCAQHCAACTVGKGAEVPGSAGPWPNLA